MRKLLVTLDDELSPLLAKYPNQSEIVRKALRLYIHDISTDDMAQIKASYKIIVSVLKDMDSKIDYLAERIK